MLHSIDPATVPDLAVGTTGCADVLGYWRESLLDVVPADAVPRQLAQLDWLGEHLPADADARPAVCMADAGSSTASSTAPRSGHSSTSRSPPWATPRPTSGTASSSTSRRADEREHWTAFGATVLCITATRAMVQWGLAGPSVEDSNPVVASWEALVDRAGRR